MCLGIPAKIIEIDHRNRWAIVECLGVQNKVYTHLIGEEIVPGNYVMVHAGHAIGKMEMDEAWETLRLVEDAISSVEFDVAANHSEKDGS